MLELTFAAEDLANTRFAISPLWEVVASSLVVREDRPDPLHRPWIDQVRPRLARAMATWRPLAEAVPNWRQIPIFVTQPPSHPYPSIELELAAVRASAEASDELVSAIEAYWEMALAPYWPRIRSLLESDILNRAKKITDNGANTVLNDLDERVEWNDATLRVAHRHLTRSLELDGRGLLIAPSVFAWPNIFSISTPPWQPTLRYPPRGIGTLWLHEEKSQSDTLAAALGRSRARLLTALDTPASTTALAARTGLTASAVSQHLTILRGAGLVSAHRTGRFVLYARTEVAESLLAANGAT